MSFRFQKKIRIAPGLAIHLLKGWPSLSTGGYGATDNVGQRGPRAALGIPGASMSWQLGGGRHIHKAVQVQADVRAVHAQGTVKAVQAQAEIIAITKRMETVAKMLTRNAAGSTYWKKAAVEQAQLLDRMLDVAKTSENDQLIAAVRKCHYAWGDGNPDFRAALDSGMTITELAAKKGDAERSNAQLNYRPAWWAAVGRNHILPVIGCGVIAVAYTIAVQRSKAPPQVIVSATQILDAPPPNRALPRASATPVPEILVTAPALQFSTPTPLPVQAAPTHSAHEQVIHDKALHHKRPTPNSTRRHER